MPSLPEAFRRPALVAAILAPAVGLLVWAPWAVAVVGVAVAAAGLVALRSATGDGPGPEAGDVTRLTGVVGAAVQATAVSAEVTAALTDRLASATERVAENVTGMATAVEEFSASIAEIARGTTEVASIAQGASAEAEAAQDLVARLADSIGEIGQVVELISSVAAETNLLALNATIEAARAGEAGKGFAVVAGEVKELARETAEATQQIRERIERIQHDSDNVVAAFRSIAGVVSHITELQATIAGAVEEQSITTSEISRAVHQAASGTNDIGSHAREVLSAAYGTTLGASRGQRGVRELAAAAGVPPSAAGDGLRARIEAAIAAHAEWKSRLLVAIDTGTAEITVDVARADDRCAFGQWLVGASPEVRADPYYPEVKRLHAEFHRAAAEVLADALAGRRREAEAGLGIGSPFARISSQLVQRLVDWRAAV